MRTVDFTVGDVPGVLWIPDDATGPRPLILLGHGGGEHKKHPAMIAVARRLVAGGGYAVAALDVPNHGDRPVDEELHRAAAANRTSADVARFQALVARQTVAEWQAALDHLQRLDTVGAGPVGYWGVSLGCGLGVPFVAAEPRVRAAVLGMGGALASADAAARVTVPVAFLVQWDDERVPREQSLALFDAFASRQKTLHANPGRHGAMPDHEIDSTVRFFARHLPNQRDRWSSRSR